MYTHTRIHTHTHKIVGDHQRGFDVTDRLLNRFLVCQILEKEWGHNETVHQLFLDLMKAYDSVRREVLYNIFIEFGLTMNLVGINKSV
jgi:hypothetical protein